MDGQTSSVLFFVLLGIYMFVQNGDGLGCVCVWGGGWICHLSFQCVFRCGFNTRPLGNELFRVRVNSRDRLFTSFEWTVCQQLASSSTYLVLLLLCDDGTNEKTDERRLFECLSVDSCFWERLMRAILPTLIMRATQTHRVCIYTERLVGRSQQRHVFGFAIRQKPPSCLQNSPEPNLLGGRK